MLYFYWRIDKDARRNKRRNNKDRRWKEDFFTNIYLPTLLQGFEKGCVGFYREWELETEHNWNILTPSVVSFLFSRAAQPEALGPLCWVMASFNASYQQLLFSPNSIRVPEGPPWPGVVFPTTLSSISVSNSTATQLARRTQLSHIIVRRPLDLWNRMFNRHQAGITVMQFRGHSLPVHQSMSVPWEFFSSSHFISQYSAHVISSHNCH